MTLFSRASQAGINILTRQDWGAKPARTSYTSSQVDSMFGAMNPPPSAGDEKKAEMKMPPRGNARFLTVHANMEPVRNNPFKEQLRRHQENMWCYWIPRRDGTKRYIIWGDTPYHFIIDSTGAIAEGRELKYTAGSNTDYKNNIDQHITVVLEGNFNDIHPTREQMISLENFLAVLAEEFSIAPENIDYHKNVVKSSTPTACPGTHLISRFPAIKDRVGELLS